jgi:hypothetical protein
MMGRLGPVSRDYLIASDERHYEAMERGSRRLRHAVEDYHLAKWRRSAVPSLKAGEASA